MTLIGVNKAQIVNYASAAEEQFGNIKTALDALVQDCVKVNYWGENAQSFKTNATTAAVTMGEEIGSSMKRFLGQVNAQTSAIARSLGGGDMSVDIAVPSFSMPAIPAANAGEQGADTAALDTLQSSVNSHRDAINRAVAEHEAALGRTPDWVGDSKTAALNACKAFTTSVTTSVQTNIAKITGFINDQKSAVIGADSV